MTSVGATSSAVLNSSDFGNHDKKSLCDVDMVTAIIVDCSPMNYVDTQAVGALVSVSEPLSSFFFFF